MLNIITFTLGPMDNNSFLAIDAEIGDTAVIDPSFESITLLDYIQNNNLNLRAVWLTHAHFDHIAGVEEVLRAYPAGTLSVGLHRADLDLWRSGGGSEMIGIKMKMPVEPNLFFEHGQVLQIGGETLEVRHTPGHTPGHAVFYSQAAAAVFCGDLIFLGSVGRTDLAGGSHSTLLESIRTQIITLPPKTRLLSGHGEETCVADELRFNPYLQAFNTPE